MNNGCPVVGAKEEPTHETIPTKSPTPDDLLKIATKFRPLSFAVHVTDDGKRQLVPIDALTGEKIDGVTGCVVASNADGKTTMTIELEIE